MNSMRIRLECLTRGRQTATPLFIFGAARSGTTATLNHLKLSPDVTGFDENDPSAFDRFYLRPPSIIQELISSADTGTILFKSFNDTPRADLVMNSFISSKGIYMVREPLACISSFVREFDEIGRMTWINRLKEASRSEAGALILLAHNSEDRRHLIAEIAASALSLLSRYALTVCNVAAAYYFFQHSFYLQLELHSRKDLAVVDYDNLVLNPNRTMASMCDFLGIRCIDVMAAGWHQGRGSDGIGAHPQLTAACSGLYEEITARRLR
jgi:hypothetical protein